MFAENQFAGTTALTALPSSLEYLWDWFVEIMPVPQGADFNTSVYAWATLVGEQITRRELSVLKRLYMMLLARLGEKDKPPMQPATDEAVLSLFSAMAKKE